MYGHFFIQKIVDICRKMTQSVAEFRVMSSIQVRRDKNWNVHLDTRWNGLVLIDLVSTILSQL
jgi:hypothetical protein